MCDPTARDSTTAALAEERGMTVVHPSNNLQVIYGQGTAVLELMSEAMTPHNPYEAHNLIALIILITLIAPISPIP